MLRFEHPDHHRVTRGSRGMSASLGLAAGAFMGTAFWAVVYTVATGDLTGLLVAGAMLLIVYAITPAPGDRGDGA